jgi:hypothetical protein
MESPISHPTPVLLGSRPDPGGPESTEGSARCGQVFGHYHSVSDPSRVGSQGQRMLGGGHDILAYLKQGSGGAM